MKKYIILSVNDNPDYLYYAPITCWAWRKLGWTPEVFYRGASHRILKLVQSTCNDNNALYQYNWSYIDIIDGYRDDTITQISRLYGACVITENPMQSYLMTGDIDMIPLSNYWNPSFEDVTVWGHDLTGFTTYPICYIGAPMTKWLRVMKLDSNDYYSLIRRDLDTIPKAKSTEFYDYWGTDQDFITNRLNEYGKDKITFINRGQGSHGFAKGRVDRGDGGRGWVLDQPELIDAHLLLQTWHSEEKIQKLLQLLRHVWPGEDFTWFENYTREFQKIAR
jgi:hypothetical protein